MVIDQLMERRFKQTDDRNGAIGAAGFILQPVLKEMMRNPFFHQKPPRTAGREQFGREYIKEFLRHCPRGAKKEDIIATATALTASSIGLALKSVGAGGGNYKHYIVAGGGAKNKTLLRMLTQEGAALRMKLSHSDDYDIPGHANEAA